MNNKLRIYACSGVGGDQQQQNGYSLFTTEGTNAISNTQAMNKLLSLINMCAADSQLVTTTPEERAQCYQDMGIYSVCFYFARLYAGDNQKLTEAGYAINKLLEDGRFKLISTDLAAHGERVDELIDAAQVLIDNELYTVKDSKFVSWWKSDILPYNKTGLSKEKQERARAALPRRKSSGAWKENADLNTYLNDGGTYFIYTYFTDDQLQQLPYVFRKKRAKQLEVYRYCKECFVPIYGTEADMQRIIANSIKFKFKESPEELCQDIVDGKQSIGIATEIIVAIIGAVVTLLSALIPTIISYCAAVAVAKYTQPADPSAGVAEESDFDDWTPGKKSNWWLWLVGAAAAWLLIK